MTNGIAPRFAAVDWGTSSFRIWLCGAKGEVIAERRSGEGMTHARDNGFGNILDAHLADMAAPNDLNVVVCGMAGARQGWVEAGYIDCPAPLHHLADRATPVAHPTRDIRILPGVAQRDPQHPDVIRGEETQLLGLLAHDVASVVVMPGTHSKWARMDGSTLTSFSTHMTGELFQALTSATLLKHAVEGATGPTDHAAFTAGVREIFETPAAWSSRLFEIRGRQLLFGASADGAKARISGILIGAELASGLAGASQQQPVRILSTGGLADLYGKACDALDLPFLIEDADAATLRGLHAAATRIWP
ncbi:2-dehydro-3-deoxygalactonokinase [Paracoccus laeviglucosivorans]|uniref:2-keto-3-deoxygalactonate kinase n=1 Tax=Paracoccus laeviglucosivorans TaxID=1197861 RepID=K7ZQX9_9RHOB|nr:2-dehydro-3-deoxygalactonokinase [Paracoccus laeviglucosivorans]BAM68209.1 2-keto-3-deoxygalactonate kinase lgnF [Paracoccus laeviglucosivorans]SMO97258.1 2-keto-3-deoxygalactonate kinase [Paracoccus laeviglucosivorans]